MKKINRITIEKINEEYEENPDTSFIRITGEFVKIVEQRKMLINEEYEENPDTSKFVGIIAKAEIQINNTIETIESGGLWGIKSDSNEKYFKEVSKDQLSELKSILAELGFSKRAIKNACIKSELLDLLDELRQLREAIKKYPINNAE